MATLLVIGGTGFFGKSILDAFKRGLLEPWYITKVIAMARYPDNFKLEYPELIFEGVEFIQADISTTQSLPQADYVIHAAASTDASKYLHQSELERRNIISGTLNYCQVAPRFHQNSKIVFCSSGAVYGAQTSDTPSLQEDMKLGNTENLPESKQAYAQAKIDSEQAIQKLGTEFSLNVSIARCFAFFGKYLPKDQHFAIGNFLADIEANRPIQVKANKPVYRSYMHADDLVEWLMTLAHNSRPSCPIYNVGSDEEVELHNLAQTLGKKYGNGSILTEITSNEVDRYIPDISKARKELKVECKYNLENGLV